MCIKQFTYWYFLTFMGPSSDTGYSTLSLSLLIHIYKKFNFYFENTGIIIVEPQTKSINVHKHSTGKCSFIICISGNTTYFLLSTVCKQSEQLNSQKTCITVLNLKFHTEFIFILGSVPWFYYINYTFLHLTHIINIPLY